MTKLDRLLDLMSPEVEYKENHKIAKATNTCIWCGEKVQWFENAYSKLEYTCSALCQKCQNEFLWGENL